MFRAAIHFTVVITVVSIVTLLYWFLYGRPDIGIDDANIYFVYIRNFAEQKGFIYQPDGERTEGFTSLLWVLITTPLYYLGSFFERSILLLNIAIISITLMISLKFVQQLTGVKTLASAPVILYIALLTLTAGYIDWTILTLMETGLWSLLLVASVILICSPVITYNRIIGFSFSIALLVLTRPESLLIVPVLITFLLLRLYLADRRIVLTKLAMPVLAFLTTVTGLIGFRLWYFSFPFPNTYYAKVSHDWVYNVQEGLRYFAFSVIQSPLLLLVCLAAAVSLLLIISNLFVQATGRNNKISLSLAEQQQFVVASITIISVIIPINLGGDHFKLLRFFQPYFPIYLFVLFNLPFWQKYVRLQTTLKPGTYHNLVYALLLIPFIYLIPKTPLHTFRKEGSPIKPEFELATLGRNEGSKMNLLFVRMDSLPSVGVSAAGGFGYSYKGRTIDLLGLNNIEMAHYPGKKEGIKNHSAFQKEVFYRQLPDIFHGYRKFSMFVESTTDTVLYERAPEFSTSFASTLFKHIFRDDAFKSLYKPVIISDSETGMHLKTYCNAAYISKLRSKGYGVRILRE